MEDEEGVPMLSFSKDGEKAQIYGPKIQLEREVYRHNTESLQLVSLMDRSRQLPTDQSFTMNENSQTMDDSLYITPANMSPFAEQSMIQNTANFQAFQAAQGMGDGLRQNLNINMQSAQDGVSQGTRDEEPD